MAKLTGQQQVIEFLQQLDHPMIEEIDIDLCLKKET